jgi:hypothetical protein
MQYDQLIDRTCLWVLVVRHKLVARIVRRHKLLVACDVLMLLLYCCTVRPARAVGRSRTVTIWIIFETFEHSVALMRSVGRSLAAVDIVVAIDSLLDVDVVAGLGHWPVDGDDDNFLVNVGFTTQRDC